MQNFKGNSDTWCILKKVKKNESKLSPNLVYSSKKNLKNWIKLLKIVVLTVHMSFFAKIVAFRP